MKGFRWMIFLFRSFRSSEWWHYCNVFICGRLQLCDDNRYIRRHLFNFVTLLAHTQFFWWFPLKLPVKRVILSNAFNGFHQTLQAHWMLAVFIAKYLPCTAMAYQMKNVIIGVGLYQQLHEYSEEISSSMMKSYLSNLPYLGSVVGSIYVWLFHR